MVMGRLGTNWHDDLNDDQQHQARKLRANEITDMFEELEPSLEEAKAAFNVFDGNDDGFIDAKELRTVLSRLWCCHSHASEANCKEMITSYDENGDGLVDFNEFLKLLGNSFDKQTVKPL
ncbi:unnamed protein product [Linum trigynum]|uniref:EF-hand domain-containing protein n=1 Tax=Linum trigynum TaxID=586398 RepID=A0AAV2GN13_9ROSI